MSHTSFSLSLLRNVLSYLFHELISPLSSLVTGLDLLEEGVESEELMPILKNASLTLRGRLEFFRAAFGAGGNSLSLSQVQKLFTNMWGTEQEVPVRFQTDVEKLPAGIGQRILLLALWLAHEKAFGAQPASLSYKKEYFSAVLNGVSLNEASLQEALIQWPETLTPKTSFSPFIGLFLVEEKD